MDFAAFSSFCACWMLKTQHAWWEQWCSFMLSRCWGGGGGGGGGAFLNELHQRLLWWCCGRGRVFVVAVFVASRTA